MNYEVAKELKDAGFPQDDTNPDLHPPWCTGWEKGNKCVRKDQAVAPTLSELIEACGRNFNALRHLTDDTWEALGNELSRAFGATPEEAVAKLWIALNKKP